MFEIAVILFCLIVIFTASWSSFALGCAWVITLLITLFTAPFMALALILCTVFSLLAAWPMLFAIEMLLENTFMSPQAAAALMHTGDAYTITVAGITALSYGFFFVILADS